MIDYDENGYFTLKNVSKNDWKLIIEGLEQRCPEWKKIENLTNGRGGGGDYLELESKHS